MKDLDLRIKEIDDLLEHLYNRLKGKKEGLSLVEPASILLAYLKKNAPQSYLQHAPGFFPVIVDALLTEAFSSFGYDGLESLSDVASDIPVISGDYTPGIVEKNLGRIRKKLEGISAALGGNGPGDRILSAGGEMDESAKTGFFRKNARGSVGLLLVSVYTSGEKPFTTGHIIRLHAEIRITGESSLRKRLNPAVAFDHISAEQNSQFEKQVYMAVRLAEDFVASTMKMKGVFRMPRQYTISFPESASFSDPVAGIMTGGSAGLAITTLLISLLGKLDLSGQRYLIRPGTIFTGAMGDTGRVLRVEDSHIGEKVRAAFYSTYTRLVVPEENLETAKKEFVRLAVEHPDRKLKIIPVSTITGTCADTEIMDVLKIPAGKPALQRILHWRKHLVSGISAAVAALIFSLFLFPCLDKTVTGIELIDSLLVMTNQAGKKVNTYNTGFTYGRKNVKRVQKFCMDDFNKDSKNEIVCLLSETRDMGSLPGLYNRLHFLIFDHKGHLIQKYIYNDEKIMGQEIGDGGINSHISICDVNMLPDSTGWGVFYIRINHSIFPPSAVIRYSLKSNSCQIFFHKGILRDMSVKDYDGDGNHDIILSGYNMELGSAVMIVLDSRYINGSSPDGYDYSIEGFDVDIAKYYIRFPDFHRYEYLRLPAMPLTVTLREADDGISVLVKSKKERVQFFFQKKMVCCKTKVTENPRTRRIITSSKIPAGDYDEKEQDEKKLLEGVRYWDGEKWVAEPVINRSYLKFAGNIPSGNTGADK